MAVMPKFNGGLTNTATPSSPFQNFQASQQEINFLKILYILNM